MLLENGGETKSKIRLIEGIDPLNVTSEKAEKLILDGQQRLTSLTQVLMFPSSVYQVSGHIPNLSTLQTGSIWF